MKIGVLCEGPFDKHSIPFLIQRIVTSYVAGSPLPMMYEHNTDGKKDEDSIKAAIATLTLQELDFIVSVFDLDYLTSKEEKKFTDAIQKKVLSAASEQLPPEKVIFAFPRREVEEWLLFDESTVKRILKIPPEQRLWDQSDEPKEALNGLIDKAHKERRLALSELREDIYTQIAAELDIELLRRCPNFSEFFDALVSSIRL